MNDWDIIKVGKDYKIVTGFEAIIYGLSHPIKTRRSGYVMYGSSEAVKKFNKAVEAYVSKKSNDQ